MREEKQQWKEMGKERWEGREREVRDSASYRQVTFCAVIWMKMF